MIPLTILTAAFFYLAGLFTRAAAHAVRERRGRGRRHHFQNARLKDVLYWKDRRELFDHCCRKAWQRRRYEERVDIGYPVATAQWSVEELVEAGIVGLWGYRREE